MAARDEKIRIEPFAPAAEEAICPTVSTRFDDAILRLAQLIGRQIAREQFERRQRNGKRAKGAAGATKHGKSL